MGVMCLGYCAPPTVVPNVNIEGYSSGIEGSQIMFYCHSGLAPAQQIMANCTNEGSWSPDPAELNCKGKLMVLRYISAIVYTYTTHLVTSLT